MFEKTICHSENIIIFLLNNTYSLSTGPAVLISYITVMFYKTTSSKTLFLLLLNIRSFTVKSVFSPVHQQCNLEFFFNFEVTCGQVWWTILGICALHLIHPSTHTHREHTPGAVGSQCCGARGAVGGSVSCSRVSPQSWYWRRRESAGHSLPTPTIPAGPVTRTRNLGLQVQCSIH